MNSAFRSALAIFRQFSWVFIGFFILFSFFQCSLSLTKQQASLLEISGQGPQGPWSYQVTTFYHIVQNGERTTKKPQQQQYQRYLSSLAQAMVESEINIRFRNDTGEMSSSSATALGNKQFSFEGKTLNLIEFENAIARKASVPSLKPAEEVSVADVIKADIKTPTISKVNLPGFTYQQAFPNSNDRAEYTITEYHEAPALQKRTLLEENDKEYLPPVKERLPRNPAVIWGPDGIGTYGGDWLQCTASHKHLNSKICTESFTRFDPSGRIQPCLAYKWEISPDYKVYTFYLRKGHKWSDGHPFTSHDIAFVCNTDIGSQRWSQYPDWMQPTDGSAGFNILDINNWDALKTFLLSEDAFAAYLRKRAQDQNRSFKEICQDENYEDEIITALNGLINLTDFYQAEFWPKLELKQDIKELLKPGYAFLSSADKDLLKNLLVRNDLFAQWSEKPSSLKQNKRASMNCMLLRRALKQFIRPPIKQRVIVEPIADSSGDDSHIIRFTFPRPNPLFLERTATFMFYRGLFSMPKHKYAPYHYRGGQELGFFDILNWSAFTDIMKNPKNRSPLQNHIWEQLSQDTQKLIQNYTEEPDASYPLGNQEQKSIVAGINNVLKSMDFYKKNLWSKIDPKVILKSIEHPSPSEYTLRDWNRYDEVEQIHSLQSLIESSNTQQLTQEHIQFFNTMMFRLAFNKEIVAIQREDGLNAIAAKQHKPYRTWVARLRDFGTYHPEFNPHPPTLAAWRIVTPARDRTMIAERNPYHYRVDVAGNQLPYFDRVVFQIEKEQQVRLLKLQSGNVDFQTRDIQSSDWSGLKAKEFNGGYRIFRWANDYCGELNFYTLQTNRDPVIGPIISDKRFRYALSLGLNREEMIDVYWQGLGRPAQCSVPEGSPFYNEEHQKKYTDYNVEQANALLDELGLDKRGPDGIRLLPNGQPLILNVNTSQNNISKILQMACNYWQKLGINAQLKQASRASYNRKLALGQLEIGVAHEGDSYFGPLLPARYAPSHPAECPQWFAWVQWYHSKGVGGTEPPASFKKRKAIWDKIVFAESKAAVMENWKLIQQMTAEELPYIGVCTSPGQIVYKKENFKNVPQYALAGWIAHQPGNCCPEVFFKESEDD